MAKILVVDDLEVNRILLSQLLKGDGHRVLCVNDGLAALDALTEFQPDLVLLDVIMPKMSGYEVAPLIKSHAKDVYLPIIFITALEDRDSLKRCLAVGGDDFLSKPFDQVILSAKVMAHCRTRELSKRVVRDNELLTYHQNKSEREYQIVERIFQNALAEAGEKDEAVAFYLSPAASFNGDVLFYTRSQTGSLYIMLGDFTGHGLAAAIGTLPASRIFYAMAKKGLAVAKIATELNKELYQLLPDDMFCAASIIEMDASGKYLTAWLGGLPDAYLLRHESNDIKALCSEHMALGILDNIEFESTVLTYSLKPKDRLLLITDGVIEATNRFEQQFGEERLLKLIQNHNEVDDIHDIQARIVKSVNRFANAIEQHDDISLVLMESKPGQMLATDPTQAGALPVTLNLKLNTKDIRQADPALKIIEMLGALEPVQRHRNNLFVILSEAYNNAVDHGLLGLDSGLKNTESGFYEYYAVRDKALKQLTEGHIDIEVSYLPERHLFLIGVSDSGAGFEHDKVPTFDDDCEYGRGLKLVNELADKLYFNRKGNQICIEYSGR